MVEAVDSRCVSAHPVRSNRATSRRDGGSDAQAKAHHQQLLDKPTPSALVPSLPSDLEILHDDVHYVFQRHQPQLRRPPSHGTRVDRTCTVRLAQQLMSMQEDTALRIHAVEPEIPEEVAQKTLQKSAHSQAQLKTKVRPSDESLDQYFYVCRPTPPHRLSERSFLRQLESEKQQLVRVHRNPAVTEFVLPSLDEVQ